MNRLTHVQHAKLIANRASASPGTLLPLPLKKLIAH